MRIEVKARIAGMAIAPLFLMVMGWAAFASPAVAQTVSNSVSTENYVPAPSSEDGFQNVRPGDIGWLRPSFGLQLGYAREPVVFRPATCSETDPLMPCTVPLVPNTIAAHVLASVGLIDRFLLFVRVPVNLWIGAADQDDIDWLGTNAAVGVIPQAPANAHLGDIGFGLRTRLLGEDDEMFALALQLSATVPTARAAYQPSDEERSDGRSFALGGENGMTFSPQLVAEFRWAPLYVTANVGGRFRESTTYASLRLEHELTYSLTVGARLLEDTLEVSASAFGGVGWYGGTATILNDPDDDEDLRRSPMEVLLGVRVRPVERVWVGFAGGFGLIPGFGAPTARALLTVSYRLPDLGEAPIADIVAVAEETPDAVGETVAVRPSVNASAPPPSATSPTEQIAEGEGASLVGETAPSAASEQGSTASSVDTSAAPVATEAPSSAQDNASSPARVASAGGQAPNYDVLDRDGDRIPDAVDRCPIDREDFDEIQDEDGCPEVDADEDGVLDTVDRCPLTLGAPTGSDCAGCPAHACVSESGTEIELSGRVEFETGSDIILDSSLEVLNSIRAIMASNAGIRRVRIEGHTDGVGEEADNLELSRRRAASVRRWMTEHEIALERFEAFGCGEVHPVETNRTRPGRRANRRVVFIIVDPSGQQTPFDDCTVAD